MNLRKPSRHITSFSDNLRMRRCHRCLTTVLALVILMLSIKPGVAQTSGGEKQDLIRSAMVFNFCKFIQWPELGAEGDSLVLGVLGDPQIAPDFSSLVGKPVGEYPITVRMIQEQEQIKECQLIYIPGKANALMHETLVAVQDAPVLTISDIDGFCQAGGMIQLVERRGKLRFFINRQEAENARLILSSQLLKVAKIVEGS